jgi:hypothetical protein
MPNNRSSDLLSLIGLHCFLRPGGETKHNCLMVHGGTHRNGAGTFDQSDPSRWSVDQVTFDQQEDAFHSCGVTLRRIRLQPAVPQLTAANAMAPGMSGVKEARL